MSYEASNTIKAILFDMDGVLIEAKDWHYEALNKALDIFGINISRIDHLTTFDGLPTKKKLAMLSATGELPVSLHDFINELKQAFTQEIVAQRCRPVFCHEFLLAQLKRDGYKLAVCSNSVRASIDLMMSKAGLTDYLDYSVSNEDVTRGKPDPEMYLKAMAHFGLSPKECLVVEDNENGIRAALASGAELLRVRETTDVTYSNVMARIHQLRGAD